MRPRTSAPREDANEHLWALSYVDLLMVLMSFFILYFNFSDKVEQINPKHHDNVTSTPPRQEDRTLSKVTVSLKAQGFGTSPRALSAQRVRESLGNGEGFIVRAEAQGESLVLEFNEELYGPGSFRLDGDAQAIVRDVLAKLKPHAGEVALTFIGHSDSAPVQASRSTAVDSNFALSGLRAAHALALAMELGFDARHVAAQGTADVLRGSRTLSILVKGRAE